MIHYQQTLLKPGIAICLILVLGVYSHAQSPGKPNVLFIAVDDLNDWTGHLGGHSQTRTPHIDQLVNRGVIFTNAHCAAPACNPSRAALMSGLRPWETGIYTNGDPAQGVLRETITLNRHFLANGYQVLGGGKIYHGFASEGRLDTWSSWVGLFPGVDSHEENFNGLNKSHFDWGPLPNKTSEMSDTKLTDWAIEQLKTAPTQRPLFLAVGYVKPHLPWYVPAEYFDRFPLDSIQLPTVKQDDLADVPPGGIKMANPLGDHAAVVNGNQWRKAVQAYLATISYLDDQVGRLLAGLKASPRADNTIVVWWTDHGWHLGEKEHWRKFALWERATRTSMAIAAPNISQVGVKCPAPVDYTNMYSTVCELAGLPIPSHVRGRSLVPLLKDPQGQWDGVAVCTHGRGHHAVRDARYRYIRYADGGEELYDHESDPHEWNNLASQPELAGVKVRLAKHMPSRDAEVTPTSADERSTKAGNTGKRRNKAVQ